MGYGTGAAKIGISLTQEQLAGLDELALQSGINRSALIRMAVARFLADPTLFLIRNRTSSKESA